MVEPEPNSALRIGSQLGLLHVHEGKTGTFAANSAVDKLLQPASLASKGVPLSNSFLRALLR